MSDFYEFALLCHINLDISNEEKNTLSYIVQGQEFNLSSKSINPCFSESAYTTTLPSGIPMVVVPAWHAFLRDGHSEFEDYLPGSFGSSFSEDRLAVRQIIHEDSFFNVWYDFGPWLAKVSLTAGLVGYYRNLEDGSIENTNLIYFEDGHMIERSNQNFQLINNFLQNLEAIVSEE